jgi:hypothetical protein
MAGRSNNLFNEFADIKALEAQQKKVLDIFSKVENGIERLNKLGFKIGNAKSTKETTDNTKQYDAAFKELEKTQKQYMANEAKLQVMRTEDYKKVQQQKLAIAELRKEQELQLKIQNAEEGSLEQMKLQFQAATVVISKFNKAKKESAEGKQFIDDTRKLSDAINDLQKKAGNFTGNVGRYAESLADGFELVRREISRLSREADKLDQAGDRGGAEKVRGSIEDLNRITRVSFDGNKSYAQSVKAISREYENMAASGQFTEEFLKEFKLFAAQAKDSAADLKDELKALSSDTRGFDLMSGALSTLASGFQVAVGASALFGDESEDVQKTLVKLTAVQNVANGVREIATQLTQRGTLANKAYVVVQKLMNTVMAEGILTAKGFKAALGLFAIAATVVVAAVAAFKLLQNSMTDAQKKAKALNDVMQEAKSTYVDAVANVTKLRLEIQAAKDGFIKKEDVVKHYNDTIGKTTGEVKNLEEAEKSLQANADAYIKFTLLKAAANIALQKAAEKAFEVQETLNNTTVGQVQRAGARVNPGEIQAAIKAEQDELKTLDANDLKNKERIAFLKAEINRKSLRIIRGDNIKADEDAQKSFEKISTDLFAQALQLSKKFKFDFFQDGDDKGDKSTNDIADRKKKALLEIAKLEIESQASVQKQILDIDTFSFQNRVTALTKYIGLKKKIIDLDAEYELSKTGLTAEEKKLIQAKADAEKIKLTEEAGKGLIKVVEKVEDAIEEIDFDTMDAATAGISDGFALKMQMQFDSAIAVIDRNTELLKDAKTRLNDVLKATFESTVFNIFDAQKLKVDALIESIDRLKDAEIARVNGSSEAQEKKEARIKLIEEKAQRDREALERRQRRIDVQRAIFDRAFKGAQISFDGIKTVGAIKLELAKATAESATNPFMLAALPLIASQIPIAIGTTAASLVSLLTAPLPKYWTGTDWAHEGLAEVAERGREIGIDPQNNITLYDKHQVAHLKEGTRIINNKVTEDIIASASVHTKPKHSIQQISKDDEIVHQLKELNNKKGSISIFNSPAIETTFWFNQHLRN